VTGQTRFLTQVSRPLKRWHIISSFHIRSNQSNLFKREHNLSSIIYSSIRTCYNDDHMTGHLLSSAIGISLPTSAQSRLYWWVSCVVFLTVVALRERMNSGFQVVAGGRILLFCTCYGFSSAAVTSCMWYDVTLYMFSHLYGCSGCCWPFQFVWLHVLML